jgi:Ca2+-binding EF-hand superfamily protein
MWVRDLRIRADSVNPLCSANVRWDLCVQTALTFSLDGLLRIGDSVMLYSVATEGVLSCDPADRVASSDRGFGVTTSTLVKAHVARNTFIIEAYGGAGEREAAVGSVLHLGQQFRLRANPLLMDGQAYYLSSQPVSALAASKVSRKQLVCMSSARSFDSVWRCAWKDIARRFEMDGQPAPANAEVLLVHAATNTALSSSPLTYYNDFGAEFEVCAHSHIDVRKSQGLFAELQGRTTTDIPFRKESSPNYFAFLTAANESHNTNKGAQQQQQAQQQSTQYGGASSSSSSSSAPSSSPQLSAILLHVREDLLTRGPDHLLSLYRSARAMDPHRSGHVSYDDLRKLLLTHGIKLALNDFDTLCRLFDPNNDKHADYVAFMAAVRGPVAPVRAQAIERAFSSMDRGGAGSVPLATIQASYNGAADPEVALKRRTPHAALDAFMVKMRALSTGGRVHRDDFFEFYSVLSAFAENDDYFVDLLHNTWRLNKQG